MLCMHSSYRYTVDHIEPCALALALVSTSESECVDCERENSATGRFGFSGSTHATSFPFTRKRASVNPTEPCPHGACNLNSGMPPTSSNPFRPPAHPRIVRPTRQPFERAIKASRRCEPCEREHLQAQQARVSMRERACAHVLRAQLQVKYGRSTRA